MVLVVEDHCFSADMLRRLLKQHGYQSQCAGTAQEALKALREHPTTRLAVLDFNLPDEDGLWLLKQIRADENLAAVRVIFLSATNERDIPRKALEAGALEWLVKGVDSATNIVAAVERAHVS